jgi:hypothetical protein
MEIIPYPKCTKTTKFIGCYHKHRIGACTTTLSWLGHRPPPHGDAVGRPLPPTVYARASPHCLIPSPSEPSEANSSVAISLHDCLCSLCRCCITGKPPRRALSYPSRRPPQVEAKARRCHLPICCLSDGRLPTLVSPPQEPPHVHEAPRSLSRRPPPHLRPDVGGAPPPSPAIVEELPRLAPSSLNPSNRFTESPLTSSHCRRPPGRWPPPD